MGSATVEASLLVAQTAARNWPPFLPCANSTNIQKSPLPNLRDRDESASEERQIRGEIRFSDWRYDDIVYFASTKLPPPAFNTSRATKSCLKHIFGRIKQFRKQKPPIAAPRKTYRRT